ncbi:MAG: Uma2 family endonuclease [Deltaproteobacteria bacterium]|nr:Uma2 family endonuclease [Deltaproteobacteria bacterium]
MIAVSKKRATYQDLVDLPENVIGEILDGELHAQPRPAVPHASSSSNLGGLLHGPFRFGRGGPGGWVILDEPELHLGAEPDVLVPDLAGWRRERMPETPGTPAISLAPDWICEVLSPSTAKIDRVKKLPIYAREAVGHAWLVDPIARTLEVYRHDAGRWVLIAAFADEVVVRAEPFDAIELELGLLFSS